ncbi:MAG TPA: hypothetical protein VFG69_06075, partial [Nannocystaceae bacterium]|nr:hypothetical protein [Nannocystaceae bacterium]
VDSTDSLDPDGSDSATAGDPHVYLQIGVDVAQAVATRVEDHVRATSSRDVVRVEPDEVLADLHPDSLVVAIGTTTTTGALVDDGEIAALSGEGFVVRSGAHAGTSAIVGIGAAIDPDPFAHASLGMGFAAYAVLEELGFGFLHPLAPMRPADLPLDAPAIDRTESPHWPVRGLQIHTMHPLELTHMLNGWGPAGPDDADGWTALLPEWDAYLEWSLANRQNRVHWVLLYSESWGEFADSDVRRDRLATIVDRAHDFGVWVGVDVPIVQHQQNTFRLIRETGELEDELAQIRDRIDWLMVAGFDYLATESGTTEFTAPDPDRMLAWMDEVTGWLGDMHEREAFIKIHASTGQVAEGYVDDDGQPLNFNFLPTYADPRLGIMPHTVQHYGLDDPAPTYGNTDFGYVRDFLWTQTEERPVVWHPETAYWVSFDIDVPLFLPVYAERRLRDLRLLAADEAGGRTPMSGQATFSSGWEWGYWLQEVVTARAAWDPRMDLDDDEALAAALDPLARVCGDAGPEIVATIAALAHRQHELLIEGRIAGVPPDDIVRRNGQAYVQGAETWDDVSDLAGSLPGVSLTMTQPDKLGLVEMRNPFHDPPGYSAEVEPLLAELEDVHAEAATDLALLSATVPAEARPLVDDLVDAARMTALRARQVHALYDWVDGTFDADPAWLAERIATARAALDEALVLATEHEADYRVDPDRIAGWGENPTAYRYGYLWTVRSLFYWWRDEAKAVLSPANPCYMNVIDPVIVGFGEGTYADASSIAADVFDAVPGLGGAAECLAPPLTEPTYPPEGLRP